MTEITVCKSVLVWGGIFAFIGVLWLLGKLIKLFRWPLYSLRNPQKALQAYKVPDVETWAVVTGASMGIGRAQAEELAKAGYNVVLIARTTSLLEQAKQELEQKYGIHVKVESADFSTMEGKDFTALAQRIDALGNVGILVNSAGLVVNPPAEFADVPLEQAEKIVSVNCAAMASLTHEMMPVLLKFYKATRKPALIVGMSSFTSRVPTPMLQVYSASKKFTQQFCAALAFEYAGRIDVISAAPWWVATQMTGIKKANWRTLSPEAFARGVFKFAGATHLEVDPYWLFSLLDTIVETIPSSWMAGPIKGFMESVRAAYFRRLKRIQEREAAEGKKKE